MSYKPNLKINGHVFRYLNASRVTRVTSITSTANQQRQVGWRYFYKCKICGAKLAKFRATTGYVLEGDSYQYPSMSCNDVKMKNLLL